MNRPTFERPIEIELIRSMARGTITPKQTRQLDELMQPPPNTSDAFIMKTGNQWLHTPVAQQERTKLFGDFWYQGELCILFADTNVGKSILAVQIGNALSRGEAVAPGLEAPASGQKVLYFDFELNTAQFVQRYMSNGHGRYHFNSNFNRLVLNPHAEGQKRFATYADYLMNAFGNVVVSTGARTLIIDNITCLRSGTETAAAAIALMRNLQALKNDFDLSILVLAHTPKRNPARPVTRNDLQGSKMLINFADSAFAIGESQTQPGTRYLKQIKQRSGQELYGAPNVCLFTINKPHNFLQAHFTGFDAEAAHLMPFTELQRRDAEQRVLTLHSQGKTMRAIADETGLSRMAVFRVVKRLGEKALQGRE